MTDASSSRLDLGLLESVDLSQPLEEGMPVWPTLSHYFKTLWCSIHYGDQATAHQLVLNEHTGTHVDAPAHFLPPDHPHHRWVDEVPLERWMGRACLVRCTELERRGTGRSSATRSPSSISAGGGNGRCGRTTSTS